MNAAAAILPSLPARDNESALAFLASRSKNSAREVPDPAEDVFKGISEMLELQLVTAIQKRTEVEYAAHFENAFPTYVGLLLVISSFVQTVVAAPLIQKLTWESLCEMEADFRDQAANAFGEAMRDQALFTVWTLRKISDLIVHIHSTKVDATKVAQDKQCSNNFIYHVYRANFSLDCLRMSLQRNLAIYPEVLDCLKDGLRSVVNAYAWVRQGVELRAKEQYEFPIEIKWDEEDEQLLSASMQNLSVLANENI